MEFDDFWRLVTGPWCPVGRVVRVFFDRCLDVDCGSGGALGGDMFLPV